MRIRYILIVGFVTFIMFIGGVKADISYDITDLNINSSSGTVTFTGWALKAGTNNYGTKLTRIAMFAVGSKGSKEATTNLIEVNSSSNNFYPVMCVNRSGKSSIQVGTGLCNAEVSSRCSNGDCIYRNVRFTSSFKIKDLVNLGSNVKFKIVIYYNPNFNSTLNKDIINGGSKSTPNSEEKYIGVYNVNCKINGSQCKLGTNEVEYNSGSSDKINLKIENVTDSAKVVEGNAKFQKEVGSTFEKISDYCKLVKGRTVKIQRRIKEMNYRYSDKYAGAEYFHVHGYAISTTASGATGCSGCGYNSAYAYATWLSVDGTLIMNFGKEELNPPSCATSDVKNLECQNGGFEYSCENSVSVKVSVRVTDPDIRCGAEGCCSSNTGSDTITATYQINQTGDLTFNLDRGPIYSGGGFTFSASYLNYAIWYYTDRVDACPQIAVSGVKYGTKKACCSTDENGKRHCTCRKLSCKTYYTYSPDCPKDSDRNLVLYESEIAKTYNSTKITKSDNMKVTMPDSNTVGGNKNTSPGEWKCGNTEALTRWRPNEPMYLLCTYELKNAFVNRTTSLVSYGNINNSSGTYLAEGKKYFVPLKWGNNGFEVSAVFKDLSAFNNIVWSGTYKCDVECQQRLFNNIPDDGEDVPSGYYHNNTPGLYLYMYRPISLSDPFPNNRQAGFNWHKWLDENKKNRLKNTYNENNIEYTVSLTSANISTIKDYNDTQLNNKGYMNNSIELNGLSKFINTYGFVKRTNADYYALGKGVYSR